MNEKKRLIAKESVEFLGEQDSVDKKGKKVEKYIKKKWKGELRKFPLIEEAYLAIITLNNSPIFHPALCLYPRPPDHEIVINTVDALAKPFIKIFASKEYVDILFLTEEERINCAKVCKPFYKKIT